MPPGGTPGSTAGVDARRYEDGRGRRGAASLPGPYLLWPAGGVGSHADRQHAPVNMSARDGYGDLYPSIG
jgi:hypothetical protein